MDNFKEPKPSEQLGQESKERKRASEIRKEIDSLNKTITNLNGRLEVMHEQEDAMVAKTIIDEGLLNESSWEMGSNLCSIMSILAREEFKSLMELLTIVPTVEETPGEDEVHNRVPDHVIMQKGVVETEVEDEYPEEGSVVLYLHPKLMICSPTAEALLEFINKNQLAVDTENLTAHRDELAKSLLSLEDVIEIGNRQKDRIAADKEKVKPEQVDVPSRAPIRAILRGMFGTDAVEKHGLPISGELRAMMEKLEKGGKELKEEDAVPTPIVEEEETDGDK